ncbi:MAG: IS1634 family transposase [Syntrophaceae bacterium]|nr:IS1634 family transposase [Syntrophaceae bacterium]
MYIKVTKLSRHGKVYEYAKIVEGYRDGTTVRQRIVMNLGLIRSEADRRKFGKILESLKAGEKFVRFNDLSVEGDLDFGVTYAVEKLWDTHGISRVLTEAFSDGRFEFDAPKIVRLLASHRLHHPSSDLAAFDWMKKRAFVGAEGIKPQHVYRTLEQLIQRKEKIEVGIFKELQRTLDLKADLVFYDLTSTYFEGEGPELAEFGYSRDHRPDRKQLVLALAMIDGIPIAHEVFEGNTADRTTLRHAVGKLKRRFDIGRIIFVADRGLFSGENLDFLDEEEYEFIIATKRRWNMEIEKLMLTPIETRGRIFAKEVKRDGKRRYILCINKDTEGEEREHLRELRRSLERKLKELSNSWTKKGAGRRPSEENVVNKTLKILGRHKRLFDLKFDNGLRYSLNKRVWKYENAIAGKFLLVTTSDLAARWVMESYRELRTVEQAFKEIKHFVDIRPIYHFNDDMVKAHVFECVLAYLTEALIGRLVPYQSARRTIQELREIRAVKLAAKGCKGVFLRTLTESDRTLFKSLGVGIPEKILG